MTDISRSVERLTQEHTELVDGRPVQVDALIVQLRDARYSSIGAGGARGASSGSILNEKAVALYEEIDGRVRGWLNHFRQEWRGELTDAVQRLAKILAAEDAGGRLEHRDEMLGMFDSMIVHIENLLDPPHEKELLFPCPECGERYEETVTTERRDKREVEIVTRQAALRVQVKPGRALVATCFCCGALWAQRQLIELAQSAGVPVDLDAVL